ncbi:hypothetical protein STANM309S_02748 [Streptomyces tanashiensis]
MRCTPTRVSQKLSGYYTSTTVGSTVYRVYHSTAKERLDVTVSPNKAGQCVKYRVQRYYSGAWHTQSTSACAALSSSSTGRQQMSLTNGVNNRYRVAAQYVPSSRDNTNISTWGAWQYFTVRRWQLPACGRVQDPAAGNDRLLRACLFRAANNSSAGYPTSSNVSPCGRTTWTALSRTPASSTFRGHSTPRCPSPTNSSAPTMDRTWLWQKASARTSISTTPSARRRTPKSRISRIVVAPSRFFAYAAKSCSPPGTWRRRP